MNGPAGGRSAARRRWILAWPGGAAIGVANGILREATFAKRLSEMSAHQASTVTAIAGLAAYFSFLERRWPIGDRTEALQIGGAWVGLTVAFDFTFGRVVANLSWRELLADYDLAAGRTWALVLLWLGAGPEVTRSLDSR